jgi:DNA polymerase-3 subunit chi
MAPRIDFYVLPGQELNGRLSLACRLAEKAYGLGYRVYLHAASPEQARQLDDRLWTFRQGSFVPHTLCPPAEGDASPVLIGSEETPPPAAGVLINLSDTVPAFFERYERVAELVDQQPSVLAKSRERFRFYRNQGYEPVSHRL